MDYDDCSHMLQKVLFTNAIYLSFAKLSLSLGRELMVLADGNAADIIEANQCTKKILNLCKKVKTHMVQIIKMHTVTPRLIAYVVCQVHCNFFSNFLVE
jgi:hypothetical protein